MVRGLLESERKLDQHGLIPGTAKEREAGGEDVKRLFQLLAR